MLLLLVSLLRVVQSMILVRELGSLVVVVWDADIVGEKYSSFYFNSNKVHPFNVLLIVLAGFRKIMRLSQANPKIKSDFLHTRILSNS